MNVGRVHRAGGVRVAAVHDDGLVGGRRGGAAEPVGDHAEDGSFAAVYGGGTGSATARGGELCFVADEDLVEHGAEEGGRVDYVVEAVVAAVGPGAAHVGPA